MYSLSVPKENGMEKRMDMSVEIRRLMEQYGNDVLRTAYMYLKNRQSAEDAYQEVFIKVYDKFGRFRGESSEKTWVLTITMNVCRDMLRGSWLKRVLLSDKPGTGSTGADLADKIVKKDESRLLFDKVLSLPTAYKEVILLYYYHEYDTPEIAGILGIAEGTVRSRLHRGREIMKAELGGRMDLGD